MHIIEYIGLTLYRVERGIDEASSPQDLEQECQHEETILPHRDQTPVVYFMTSVSPLHYCWYNEKRDKDARAPWILGKWRLNRYKISDRTDTGAANNCTTENENAQ